MKKITLVSMFVLLTNSCSGTDPEVDDVRYTKTFLATTINQQTFDITVKFVRNQGFTYSRIIRSTSPNCPINMLSECSNVRQFILDEQTEQVTDQVVANEDHHYVLEYRRNADEAVQESYLLKDATSLSIGDVVSALDQYKSSSTSYNEAAVVANITLNKQHSGVAYNLYRSSDNNCDWQNYALCSNSALFTTTDFPVADNLMAQTDFYYHLELDHNGVTNSSYKQLTWQPSFTDWALSSSDTSWDSLNAHTSLVSGSNLWVFGGNQVASSLAENNIYSSASAASWQLVANAPQWEARADHASVMHSGEMWVVAGTNGVTAKNDIFTSTDGINWAQKSTPPWAAREQHALLSFNSKLWLIGGKNLSGLANDIWQSTDGVLWYQSFTGKWSQRYNAAITEWNNKLWVLGGVDSSGHETNHVFTTSDGVSWQQKPEPQWSERQGHSTLVYNGMLWVIGGSSVNEKFNDLWFTQDGILWKQVQGVIPWSPRSEHTNADFLGRLFIIGGNSASGGSDLWSASTLKWQAIIKDYQPENM